MLCSRFHPCFFDVAEGLARTAGKRDFFRIHTFPGCGGHLVCAGIFGMFLTYMLVNFGMLLGIVPVAGIPLPFISYGGSNLVASLWALGVVQSVYARRIRA